ncbi:unnamed protein product [Urochloa humidicola]
MPKRGGDDITRSSCKDRRRKAKRGGDDITRSLHKNRRALNFGGEIAEASISGYLHGVSNQDVLTELVDEVKSNLSKSVASLALCSGDSGGPSRQTKPGLSMRLLSTEPLQKRKTML